MVRQELVRKAAEQTQREAEAARQQYAEMCAARVAAEQAKKAPQPEIIHGSLLTYRELLLHGAMVSQNRIIS